MLGCGCNERAEGTGGSEKAGEVAEYTIRNPFIQCTAWPMVAPTSPTAQLLHTPYTSQREHWTRSPETWPLGLAGHSLAVGLGCVSMPPWRARLPPLPNKRRHMLVSKGPFPLLGSGARAKAPWQAAGPPRPRETQLCFS